MQFKPVRTVLKSLAIVAATVGLTAQARDAESADPPAKQKTIKVAPRQVAPEPTAAYSELQKEIGKLRGEIKKLRARESALSEAADDSVSSGLNGSRPAAGDPLAANSGCRTCQAPQPLVAASCGCGETVRAAETANVKQTLQWVGTNHYRILLPASQAAALIARSEAIGRNVYSTIPSTELMRTTESYSMSVPTATSTLVPSTGAVYSSPSYLSYPATSYATYPSYATYSNGQTLMLPLEAAVSNGVPGSEPGISAPVASDGTPVVMSPVSNGTGYATYGGYGIVTAPTTSAITGRGDVLKNDVWPASGGLRTHVVTDSGWQTLHYRGAQGVTVSPSLAYPQVVIGR